MLIKINRANVPYIIRLFFKDTPKTRDLVVSDEILQISTINRKYIKREAREYGYKALSVVDGYLKISIFGDKTFIKSLSEILEEHNNEISTIIVIRQKMYYLSSNKIHVYRNNNEIRFWALSYNKVSKF